MDALTFTDRKLSERGPFKFTVVVVVNTGLQARFYPATRLTLSHQQQSKEVNYC